MGKRVLVAEDEPSIAESLKFLLVRAGFDVSVETNGTAAMQELSKDRPDVLVLDVMMPGLDGYSILKQLRAAPDTANLPVIMLTAKGQAEDRATALECGADAFITKPFSNAEIVDMVTRFAG